MHYAVMTHLVTVFVRCINICHQNMYINHSNFIHTSVGVLIFNGAQ